MKRLHILIHSDVMLNGKVIHYSMEEAIERLDPFGDLAIRTCTPCWQMDVPVPKAAAMFGGEE